MTEQELIAQLLDEETDLADCVVDYIEQTQAKLTKAMEALRDTTHMLSQCQFTDMRHKVVKEARAVLAELEGKE